MKKVLALLLAVIMILTMFAGCGAAKEEQEIAAPAEKQEAEKDKLVIGLPLLYRRDEFWKDIEYMFKAKAEEYGFELVIADADLDVAKQTQIIEDMIQQKVDIIALPPCDPSGVVPAIESCEAAGIPVITFDGAAQSDYPLTFVGFDYYQDGVITGEVAVEFIKENYAEDEEVQIAIVDFPASTALCVPIVNGYVDVVTQLPNVKIVAQQDGKASRADSMAVMENILSSNPDVDIVMGINPDTCLGAYAAVQAAGREDIYMSTVGWAEELFTLYEEKDPQIIGGAANVPHVMVETVLKMAKAHFEGKDAEAETLAEIWTMGPKTVGDYDWKSLIALRDQ